MRTQKLLGVIRASDGALVDVALGPEFVDRIERGAVEILIGGERLPVQLERIELRTGEDAAVVVRGRVRDGLRVATSYRIPLSSSHLELSTEVYNPSDRDLPDVAVGDHLALVNTRLQLPGVGEVLKPMTARAPFCAREEAGVSYLLATSGWREMDLSLEMWPPLRAFDPDIKTAYGRSRLPAGAKAVYSRVLVLRRGGVHLALAEALSAARGPRARSVRATIVGPEAPLPKGSRLVIRRDGHPFLLTRADRDGTTLKLPASGQYELALQLPGAGEGAAVVVPSEKAPSTVEVKLERPTHGRLAVIVEDTSGHPLAAKLILHGAGGTPTPDFGADGGLHLSNVAYVVPGETEILLAPGNYRALATRGFDFELAERPFQIEAGRTSRLRLRLARAVSSPGWISADLHVHGPGSWDSPVQESERLVSAAALGLDAFVSTDHNHVTSYASSPAPFAGAQELLLIPGEEVTTESPAIGHFNVFPLPLGRRIDYVGTTPERIFAQSRKLAPDALIQANHPRRDGGLGYFDRVGYDPKTGKPSSPLFSDGFDLLEAINGDQLSDQASIGRVLTDWFALLNRGRRITITGGSDAHRLPYQDVGYPRTLIWWDPSPAEEGAPASRPISSPRASLAQLIAALRQGRTVVTTGPFVALWADGQPIGSLVSAKGGEVKLRLQVRAASWIDVSTVELWANGVRELVLPPRRRGTTLLSATRRIRGRHDSWYVVIVRGRHPDRTQQREGVLPFAVTCPVWVDFDGDGKFTPPLPPSSS